MVGIVGYGCYIPRYRIRVEEIAKVWGADAPSYKKGLLLQEKSVPGPDQETITMSVEATRKALLRAKINPEELPPTELKYELFASAVERLTAAGYRQIGMDHFALPEDELSLAQQDGRLHRNFMGYTVQSAPEMVGLGMSAISYVAESFFQNVSRVDSYKRSVSEHGLAVYRGKKLSDDDLIRQYVIASLMCNFRLDFARVQERFGVAYSDYFAAEHELLDTFIDDKLVLVDKDGVRVTPLGRTFVRNIAMVYDAYLKADRQSTAGTFSRTI